MLPGALVRRLVGRGEVAHHQGQIECAGCGEVSCGFGIGAIEAEPVHAGFELDRRRGTPSNCFQTVTPDGDVAGRREDRDQTGVEMQGDAGGFEPLQDEDARQRGALVGARQGIERGTHDPAFLGPGDEEVAAARGVERAGGLGSAEAIAVGLDRGAGARAGIACGQQGPVGGQRRAVDLDHGHAPEMVRSNHGRTGYSNRSGR